MRQTIRTETPSASPSASGPSVVTGAPPDGAEAPSAMVEAPATHPLARPGLALATIALCQFMVMLDVTVVMVALPEIRTDLGFSVTGLSWVLNLYVLAYGGLLLLGGRLGDLLGRRATLRVGIVLFTAASALAGCAPSAGWLLAARAAQGVGGALAAPSTLALIATLFTGAWRIRAMAVFSAVVGLSLAVGLILGGALTEWGSWRWVFWINLPIGVALTIALPLILPRLARTQERRRLDVVGAVTGTISVASLVYTVVSADDPNPFTIVTGVVAVVGLTAFVLVERRVATPLLPLRLLADRRRRAAYLTMLGFPAAMFGVFFFLGQYLQGVQGESALRTGLAYLPMAVAQLGILRLTPRLLARFGARRLVVIGTAAVAVATGWLGLLDPTTPYATGILGPMLLVGAGVGVAFMPLNLLIVDGTGADAGAASGLLQTLQQLGGALGLALLVTVADHVTDGATDPGSFTDGLNAAFRVAAVLAFCVGVFAAVELRPRPE